MERAEQVAAKYSQEDTALPARTADEVLREDARREILRMNEEKDAAVASEIAAQDNWVRVRAKDQAVIDLITKGEIKTSAIQSSIEDTYAQFHRESETYSQGIGIIVDNVMDIGSYPRGNSGSAAYTKADIPTLVKSAAVSDRLVAHIDAILSDQESLEQLTQEVISEIEVAAHKTALATVRDQDATKAARIKQLEDSLDAARADRDKAKLDLLEATTNWDDKLLEDTANPNGRSIDISTLDTLKNPGVELPMTAASPALIGARAARSIVELDDATVPVKVPSLSLYAD